MSSKNHWNEEKIAELKTLAATKTNEELSQYYGVSYSGIRAALLKHGLKRAQRNFKNFKFKYEKIRADLDKPCKICTSHYRTSHGYPLVTFKGKRGNLHSLLYEDVYGSLQEGEVVRHKCDNPPCCEMTHLEKGSVQDNVDDKVVRNRQTKGIEVNTAILTDADVALIKASLGSVRGKILAEIYKVSPSTISDIKKGRTWKHI